MLFIGTQCSNLYNSVDTPAKGLLKYPAQKYVFGELRLFQSKLSKDDGASQNKQKHDDVVVMIAMMMMMMMMMMMKQQYFLQIDVESLCA